jgi:geranylgeranyl pyrophosphate synthase
MDKSRRLARQLTERAFDALKAFSGRAVALEALAQFLLTREK